MAEPFLHLGNVGLVVESIRGGRCAEGVGANLKAKPSGILLDKFVDAVRCDTFPTATDVIAERPKKAPASSSVWPAASRYSRIRPAAAGCTLIRNLPPPAVTVLPSLLKEVCAEDELPSSAGDVGVPVDVDRAGIGGLGDVLRQASNCRRRSGRWCARGAARWWRETRDWTRRIGVATCVSRYVLRVRCRRYRNWDVRRW
jgi:hypothetical protein